MTIYSAILEIEAHANGKDLERHNKTISDLRKSCIQTHGIMGVITERHDEATRIKHFGYDYRCENGCQHEPSSYGVLRYFGITLVIPGFKNPKANRFLFGDYKVNEYARVTICGHETPYDGERKNLEACK